MARENPTFIVTFPLEPPFHGSFPVMLDDWRVKENLPDTGANFYMVPGAIIQDHQPLVISRHRPAANLVKLR